MGRWSIALIGSLALGGCQLWWNAEAYFNTYYNMHRLMKEVESEFEYYDETRRTERPRVLVPDSVLPEPLEATELPTFLRAYVIEPPKLQVVQQRLDSILRKGSKLLALRARSELVDDALLLMAQTFFYRGEWLPAQVKCQELLQLFPNSPLAADAQLLLAKSYLMQRKIALGKRTLSRTIDAAWRQGRSDILAEAYRLLAELALAQGDAEGALRPYRHAVAIEPDARLRARWQLELAALLYRLRRYEEAAAAFQQVLRYSPELVVEFEARLYRAAALIRSGGLAEAEALLQQLKSSRRYAQWVGYVLAQELTLRRRAGASDEELRRIERQADSAFSGNPALLAAHYEYGLELLQQGDLRRAQRYIARATVARSPVFARAQYYNRLLARWEQATATVESARQRAPEELPDTLRTRVADALYELGRVYAQLGKADSVERFYRAALRWYEEGNPRRARALLALGEWLRSNNPAESDSLLEQVVWRYPATPYSAYARQLLGYTEEAVVDTAAELYRSGMLLQAIGEYAFAQRQWQRVVEGYPESPYAPKALYALGWLYERRLGHRDSALAYYAELVARYPQTPYAREVYTSVLYALAHREGVPVDSIQQRYPGGTPSGEKGRGGRETPPPVLEPVPEPPPVQPDIPMPKTTPELPRPVPSPRKP